MCRVVLRAGVLLVASSLFAARATAQQEADARQHAVEEAAIWLDIVDDGRYTESWERAARLFRRAMTKERWVGALTDARTPLGPVVSRTVKSAEYTTTVPGAPPGEYVVIQFETSFTNMPSAIELVTPMLDADGAWRVSGYFIQQGGSSRQPGAP